MNECIGMTGYLFNFFFKFCSLPFPLAATDKLQNSEFDCLLLVIDKLTGLPSYLNGIKNEIENHLEVNKLCSLCSNLMLEMILKLTLDRIAYLTYLCFVVLILLMIHCYHFLKEKILLIKYSASLIKLSKK